MPPILIDLSILCALSLAVVAVGQRIGLPNIVGYLLAGVLAGPSITGFVSDSARINDVANLGVTLLLFTIGVEFSVGNLMKLRIPALIGGPLQIALTTLPIVAAGPLIGLGFGTCVVIGFAVAQSSTAIVIKLYQKTGEAESAHSRAFLGVSIFQDISSVPILLAVPMLAGSAADLESASAAAAGAAGAASGVDPTLEILARTIAVLLGLVVVAKWVVPAILFQVAKQREDELFLAVIVVIGLGIASTFAAIGLSIALGAFFSGLIISQSGFGPRALASVLPFRDLFLCLFFASIGMLLNVQLVIDQPLLVAALLVGLTALKFATALVALFALRLPFDTAILAAVALAQIGEFSFVVFAGAAQYDLIHPELLQLLLGVAILSMIAAPFYVPLAHRLVALTAGWPWPQWLKRGQLNLGNDDGTAGLTDHLVIIGYGLNGQNLTRAANAANIPYIAVDMNPMTVRRERANGVNIIYGDASHDATLKHLQIETARVVVLAVSDVATTRRTTDAIHRVNPAVHLLVRTRYLAEIEPLKALGASEVIPEEYETAMEIFTRVLRRYLVPREQLERFIGEIRADSYGMLRRVASGTVPIASLKSVLGEMEVGSMMVGAQCFAAGRTLGELHLRANHGVTVLAVRRGEQWMATPNAATRLDAGDLVLVSGLPEKLAAAAALFHVVVEPTDERPTHRSQVKVITRKHHTRLLQRPLEALPPTPTTPDIT